MIVVLIVSTVLFSKFNHNAIRFKRFIKKDFTIKQFIVLKLSLLKYANQ